MPSSTLTGGSRLQYGPLAKLSYEAKTTGDLSRVDAALTRGPNMASKSTVAAWSNTWPAPGSTLDLDFANNRGYVRGVGQGGVMDAITFTRASSGTWVDSTGLLRSGAGTFTGTANATGVNLLTFPQDFDNAAWTKQNATISANAIIAPNGTLTGSLCLSTAGNNIHRIYNAYSGFSVSATTTFSAYVQKGSSNFCTLACADGNNGYYAVFDLQNGTVTQSGGLGGTSAISSSSITSVGGGWYRCVISGNGSNRYSIISVATSGTYTPDTFGSQTFNSNGTESVYAWGAQLELGSTATTYYPTNINAPRFDWASTAQLPQNIQTYSQDFTQTSTWRRNSLTLAANSITAPDGTLTGTVVTINGTSNILDNYPTEYNVASTLNTYRTWSIYVSSAGASPISSVYLYFGLYASAVFNISTGAISNISSGTTANAVNVGGGWWRISIGHIKENQASTFGIQPFPTNTASGTFGIWGAQLQAEQTATTYLANTGAFVPTNTPLAANTTSNGLLIEESRTNRLLWCRDATQSNWTKTNITAAKNQTGVDGVANAASSLTASADNGTCIQTITLASGSRTGSVYLKRITGTGTVQVSLDGSTWSTVDLSNGLWNRIVLSGTVTNPVVGIRIATNGDAVAMDYGQVEDGTFATSPILTTTATATRSADVGNVSTSAFAPNAGGYNKATLYANFVPVSLAQTNAPGISMRDAIGNGNINSIAVRALSNGNFQAYLAAGAVTQYSVAFTSPGGALKAAISFNGGLVTAAASGNTGSNASLTVPAGSSQPLINSLVLGSDNVGTVPSMWVKRAVFYPSFQNLDGLRTLVNSL